MKRLQLRAFLLLLLLQMVELVLVEGCLGHRRKTHILSNWETFRRLAESTTVHSVEELHLVAAACAILELPREVVGYVKMRKRSFGLDRVGPVLLRPLHLAQLGIVDGTCARLLLLELLEQLGIEVLQFPAFRRRCSFVELVVLLVEVRLLVRADLAMGGDLDRG